MSDEMEIWFERGVTDGLPVVPPTRERVERMLHATKRSRETLVAEVPPNFGRATVEKLAVNAVMAGCRPEYFLVVLAVVEAACDPRFNLHGQSGTTNATSPLIIINGPLRSQLGVNCAAGVFGPGFRANATIGRALRLVMINLGGTRAGEISMSTLGHPGRYTYCIGEHEEVSPWEPLHVERGHAPGPSPAPTAGRAGASRTSARRTRRRSCPSFPRRRRSWSSWPEARPGASRPSCRAGWAARSGPIPSPG